MPVTFLILSDSEPLSSRSVKYIITPIALESLTEGCQELRVELNDGLHNP
jgi:hypothetical protein